MSAGGPSSLAALFPEGDYRFHLGLRRAEPAAYFAPRDSTGAILAERARWLEESPARYAGLVEGGAALVSELADFARHWCTDTGRPSRTLGPEAGHEADSLVQLGACLEPDILLLSRDMDEAFRLRAGALCFPTGWALEEKLGHPLDVIHGVVPGLNAAVGASVQQFLEKMKPGAAYLRDNWGIAATNEMNLHPARGIAAPCLPVTLDRLWLRVEHQALVALPVSGGILFGIRIALHRLDEIARGDAAAGFRRALETMPSEIARYKRLDAILPTLLTLL